MEKRVFIVHGWGGSPDEPIHKWLKKELEKNKDIKVVCPVMPDSEYPEIDPWVKCLSKHVGKCDENTFFFGHSIGCQTIMRYLQTLNDNQKSGGAIFLSGWFNLDNLESQEKMIAKPWIETSIDFKKIRNVCKKFEVIISDDEPYGYVNENSNKFKKELNANVTIESNKGHFTEEYGVTQIPEVLNKLLKLINKRKY